MKLTEKKIEEIAENLECGMRCFYNLRNGEIRTLLNFESWIGADEEPWQEESREIEENRTDYYEFEGMDSHDSFRIMADFAESVDDTGLRKKLIQALNRRKPFQNFKSQIDYSEEYRQQWFDFKKMRYIQWVEEQFASENEEFFNE